MGNILRRISKPADGESNKPIPAASELEKDLPKYAEDNNLTGQRLSVWALVEPPHAADETKTSLSSQDYVTSAIQKGSRIHRVISGGGGWGKKQGLLSLDPETSFTDTIPPGSLVKTSELFRVPDTTASYEQLSGRPVASASIGEDLSVLSQAAREGDYVRFFVSGPKTQKNESSTPLTESVGTV
jgi:hypothetical protein